MVTVENWRDGIISQEGEYVGEPNFLNLGFRFSEGLLSARTHDGTTGYVQKNGMLAFEVPLVMTDNIGMSGTDFENGYAIVHLSDNPSVWRVINHKGEFVSGELKVLSASGFQEGFSRVIVREENGYRYGYLDTSGNYLYPPILDEISPFMSGNFINGFAIISLNGRDGLLDTNGIIFWSDEIMGSR